MRFLYVFALMFLSIFGLVVLLKILVNVFLCNSLQKFDIYVRDCENIDEFLENARKTAFIGKITVITDKSGSETKLLTEKYADVGFVGSAER